MRPLRCAIGHDALGFVAIDVKLLDGLKELPVRPAEDDFGAAHAFQSLRGAWFR